MSCQITEGFTKSPVPPVRLGRSSGRGLDFFYLCSYDVDGPREFLETPEFSKTYDMDKPFMRQLPATRS